MATVLEANDAETAAQIIADSYTRLRMAVSGANRWMRIVQTPLGDHASLDQVTFSMTFSGRGDPMGLIPLGRVRSGTVAFEHPGGVTRSRAGDVMLGCQPDCDVRLEVHDFDGDLACLDPALLDQVAADAGNRSAVRFTGYRPVSGAAAEKWNTVYAYVLDASVHPAATGSTLLAGSLARLLAATALTVFPNTAVDDPTLEERRDAHAGTLRRAIVFIDENAHRDISVADIAAAARVTIRTVQLAFRRHLGTTPVGYLRKVRLDHVHRDLRAADPATGTVQEIAATWGFADRSRFAAAYRAAYGVRPSHTLWHTSG